MHAGATRKRINVSAWQQMLDGVVVHHWVRPTRDPYLPAAVLKASLEAEEEALIQ
jgi:hypothetical protein